MKLPKKCHFALFLLHQKRTVVAQRGQLPGLDFAGTKFRHSSIQPIVDLKRISPHIDHPESYFCTPYLKVGSFLPCFLLIEIGHLEEKFESPTLQLGHYHHQ
ncbi:hypothetical protein V8G54_027920 [Vigna mungo]|uniref:Uncharacterized protein n=1 Tax=Vigna mungo TaxID=3915 RepID=A0AAQ3MQH7_VIGMU